MANKEIKITNNPRAQLAQLVRHQSAAQATTQIVGSNSHRLISDRATLRSPFVDLVHVINEAPSPAPDQPPPSPPAPHLDQLQLDTGTIGFGGGVPVGGNSHLSLYPNGQFSFTGHFHVSGATSYDVALVWVIKAASGATFVFPHNGRVHGTFEAGSRDNDWGDSNTNPVLATAWTDISTGYAWHWNAAANLDIGALIDSTVKAIGQIGTAVTVITTIVG